MAPLCRPFAARTITSDTGYSAFGPGHGTRRAGNGDFGRRAAWALVNVRRPPIYEGGWLGRFASAGQVALYLLMFIILVLALVRSYGSGEGWVHWGLQIISATGRQVGWITTLANALHSPLAWLIAVLICGHILMALGHPFIGRDGILAPMAGSSRLEVR